MDVAYLASSAVNGTVPDAERVSRMDLNALYQTADRHLLTGITAMALESAGVKETVFDQAKGKAIRKVAVFDVERTAVLAKLEASGIWHMPLKGAVLKDLYPRIGMRQMADNDILYDASRSPEVKILMKELGFSAGKDCGRGNHDHYYKPPVCHFEMHRTLFRLRDERDLAKYYHDVIKRLIPNEGESFGYHFSDDDFYIFMIAHEYKHYISKGTGIRSSLDTYVYLKKKGETLDWPYITGELEELGIAGFEAKSRNFAMHLFNGEALTEQDRDILEYMLSSGAYGTLRNQIHHRLEEYGNGPIGKAKYVFHRLFLPMDEVRTEYPGFAKYPVFLPFLPVYRLVSELLKCRANILNELKALNDHK